MTVGSTGRHGLVLDPIERLSEILFGLIMVLSFTCSISVATADHEEVRSVLIGAIGCNLAWGIVDAVMYLLTILIERGRNLAIAKSVRACDDPERGRKLLAEALPEPLDQLFEGSALETARARLVALPQLRKQPHVTLRDLRGAFGVFLLVFLSTFPVVVPFLFTQPLHRSMRMSNAVALVMLYLVGQRLGRFAEIGAVRTGLAMMAIGVVLVGLTIALGG